jgi:hypothetical protein
MTYDGCHGCHQNGPAGHGCAVLFDKTIPSELCLSAFARRENVHLGRWLIPAVKIHNGKLDQLSAHK